jgi:esterase/lipase
MTFSKNLSGKIPASAGRIRSAETRGERQYRDVRAVLRALFLLSVSPACIAAPLSAGEPFEILRSVSCEDLARQTANAFDEANSDAPRFFQTAAGTVKGVAVVAHGLNIKPSRMGAPGAEGTLVALLLDSGYHVVRVTLAGHSGSLERMKTVSASRWLSDAYVQYSKAYCEARKASVPVYLIGFSLGALVFEALMNTKTETPVQFEKAVLFSPALALKNTARAAFALTPLLKPTSFIPSKSPAPYRAQKGASLAAYQALFALEEQLYAARFAYSNIETLLFIDPDDELISMSTLQKRIAEYELSRWNTVAVTNSGARIAPRYHHLIIDADCAGEETWRQMTAHMVDFFSNPVEDAAPHGF